MHKRPVFGQGFGKGDGMQQYIEIDQQRLKSVWDAIEAAPKRNKPLTLNFMTTDGESGIINISIRVGASAIRRWFRRMNNPNLELTGLWLRHDESWQIEFRILAGGNDE